MIGKTVSQYKIIKKIGGVGIGIVYKAQGLKLDLHVALKFLPHELTRDPEAKHRFIHEKKAASAIQHSDICIIHEINETNVEQLYIVMDYYEGEKVKEREKSVKLSQRINK
jgi:serine/threonine protein kinase